MRPPRPLGRGSALRPHFVRGKHASQVTKKILVIHQGALGDLVLSFGVLVSLKHEMKASLTLLCSSKLGKVAHELNVADAYFPLESARFSTLFCESMTPPVKIFISDYDIIILISFSDAIEQHIRHNHRGEVYRLSPRPPVGEEVHVASYLKTQLQLRNLLIHPDTFCISASTAIHPPRPQWVLPRQKHLIVIHPGAGSVRKRWPVGNFVQAATIIRREGFGKVVLVLGPAESDLASVFKSISGEGVQVRKVADLSYVIGLLRRARCFIGNDSGVTHLSAFMGLPTVAIFGPSDPVRWSPIGHSTRVLRGSARCDPCFELEPFNCEEPRCLSGVSVNEVMDAVRALSS